MLGPYGDAAGGAPLALAEPSLIAQRQDELLRRHVAYCAGSSPFYRRLFQRTGIAPEKIRGAADLSALPFTEKSDLEREGAQFLAVAQGEVIDLCLTSGTTGRPVAMLQSAADLERLAYNEELSFRGLGISSDDRVLIAAAIDRCFMAGLAYFLGLTRIGATVIRGGSGSATLVAEMVKTCRPTALVGVPSLLLGVAERLLAAGVDPAGVGVSRVVCIGEPVRNADLTLSPLGNRLAAAWGATIFGTYASTEMATSFTDCAAGCGGHLHPDLIVVEIVDEAGAPVPPGTPGEVVATPLATRAMPLLRFRTGDIAALHLDPCACGRNTPRLGPVLGRKSQMLKYRGTTVYPPAIAAVLQGLHGVRGYYIEAESDFPLSDRIRVVVGSSDPSLSADQVADAVGAALRVRPEVAMVSPEEVLRVTLREDKRKPVTFFDRRGGTDQSKA